MSGVSFYVSNGKTPNLATNETAIGTFSSLVLDYQPNTILYLVAVALDVNPVLNFTYKYYSVPQPIIIPNCTAAQYLTYVNNTYLCALIPPPPAPIIVNITNNETIIITESALAELGR